MEVNGSSGASADELRGKVSPASHKEGVDVDGLFEEPDFNEKGLKSPLVAELMEINPLLSISIAEKMAEAEITEGQAKELLNNAAPRRGRVKFVCERIEGLTSREIADIIGIKHANAIYKHVDKLNEEFEEEGFYYELITSGQKKAPTKVEIEQYKQKLANL